MATEQNAQRNPETAKRGASGLRNVPIKPAIPKNRVSKMTCLSSLGYAALLFGLSANSY
jgi:hypothetical protein